MSIKSNCHALGVNTKMHGVVTCRCWWIVVSDVLSLYRNNSVALQVSISSASIHISLLPFISL